MREGALLSNFSPILTMTGDAVDDVGIISNSDSSDEDETISGGEKPPAVNASSSASADKFFSNCVTILTDKLPWETDAKLATSYRPIPAERLVNYCGYFY